MESLLVYDVSGQTPLNVVFDDLEQKLRDTDFSDQIPRWYEMMKSADAKKLKSNIPSIILSFLADNVVLVTKGDESGVNLTLNSPVYVQTGDQILIFAKGDRVSVNGVILTPQDCKYSLFRSYSMQDLLRYGFIDATNYKCFRKSSITAFDFEAQPTADALLQMVEYLTDRDDLISLAYMAEVYGGNDVKSPMFPRQVGFFTQESRPQIALDSRFVALQKVSAANLAVWDQDLWGVLQFEQLEHAYVLGRVFGFSSEEFFAALKQKQNMNQLQKITKDSNVAYDASKLLILQKRIVAQRLFKLPLARLSREQLKIVDMEVAKVTNPEEKTEVIRLLKDLKRALQ